ncbi:ABC transporter substrate-binding protein [Roseomonas elaeocarpi]|uniref:ABC transporter substrate-binding protein n=1 Tax=Roseomonas elaeocarpi TaxID=907779 RepID=A0ABV6JUT1_9PROT
MTNLHRRSVAAALLAAPVLLSGRARAQGTSSPGTTVLRVGDQKGGAQSLIAASGLLEKSDLRIEWSQFAAAAPLAEALNAGAIDVGGIGDAPFAFARAAGAPIRAVGATRSSGGSTALVVRRDAPYRSFADLKGRTIGTGKGSVGHFLILAAREKAGLAASDIRIAFLSPSEAKAAFASGQIDAWSTWSQYVHLAVAEDGARILLDGQGLMSGLSFQVATESAIAAKPRELRRFIALWSEALRWGNSNLDLYAAAWARETGVSAAVARATLDARGFTPAPIDASVIAAQQRTVDLYARERILRARYDVGSSFDPGFSA